MSTSLTPARIVHGIRWRLRKLRGALSWRARKVRDAARVRMARRSAQPRVDAFMRGEAKRPLGIVGFFGHGNYGDELFLDVFHQHLGDRFELSIIPDLEAKPYFSRPVEEKVAEVDAILMGGGDLIQRWNTDPRYFDREYLTKPFFVAGVGVPIYEGSEKHLEKEHIIRRLQGFFRHPNVKFIGMRDDFGANWIRTKIQPTAPVVSEPDIVCSLDLPPATKPEGAPILGIVTRQRRVDTPDDYTRLIELAEHAKARGWRIRHIVLGTGSVGERDVANAEALAVEGKELVYTESLDELSVAIGECTALASMKFHGTVVATMYGVPSMVLIPTNKNVNFMERIGRGDLVAQYNSDRLLEIFGENGPEPIAAESVAMLRERSTALMQDVRARISAEVANAIIHEVGDQARSR
ncbi:polysaccharide pyruvyl transferase family protein [Demequina sp.]|uniref:polysaccharide pyruvyl transferase family protein n=1 Tax=Demequina sp. TaxID=2050685 RepID=UPI0025FF8427|nr:polysaccharide pyruvyl transferase family protein [Demequina sp.]